MVDLTDSDNRTSVRHYVITHKTKDYGSKFVVRGSTILPGEVIPDSDPLAVVDTLDAARERVPTGLVRIPPHPFDDPVIVEIWI